MLHPDDLDVILDELKLEFRERIFTPETVVRMFLAQVLSDDPSCRNAVAGLIAAQTARGELPCSPNTGSYCTARGRLPEELLRLLARRIGQQLATANDEWSWKGRVVKLVDGTTVSMPDTPENRAAFPQSKSQKPGVGFPLARLVVVFSLAVGTTLDMEIAPYRGKQTGENSLFRTLWDKALVADDVVLGDRFYCSYHDIALLTERQVDIVFRKHQLRETDFRRGQRLGKRDHWITWKKPHQRPSWMDAETFAALPEQLTLREVQVQIRKRGIRVRQLTIITTLLDATTYSRDDLADLYHQRWNVELDLRSIKSTMHMDVLRTETPAMIRKEIWAHLLAYNLIRLKMAQAAVCADCLVRQISFKGAVQTYRHFLTQGCCGRKKLDAEATLLAAIAYHRVGNRPDRYEPRAVKRRPKPHKLLKVPRNVARNRDAAKA